ncbi:hypothetical protein KFK09_008630 [Dendrobium nobile]|uniref:Reverse transcriptase domain-containing protein n=1 Tax=Dendrobium nobile TaxID=94219 RepID=A0A8T3BN91_DENNO|nr:hypothetical protein KFK09_008630 [Dendrobium nobile]
MVMMEVDCRRKGQAVAMEVEGGRQAQSSASRSPLFVGPLVIKEVSDVTPKLIKHVEGKGKSIAEEVGNATPRSVKTSVILSDLAALSSGMKFFVNQSGVKKASNGVKMFDGMPSTTIVMGNVNPWSNKPYIKLDSKEEEVVLSEDGKAVMLNEELELLNSKKLLNSLVIKVIVEQEVRYYMDAGISDIEEMEHNVVAEEHSRPLDKSRNSSDKKLGDNVIVTNIRRSKEESCIESIDRNNSGGEITKEAGNGGELNKMKLVKELRSLGPIKNAPRARNMDWGDGLSGGIMVLWRSDMAYCIVLKMTDQCVIRDLTVFNKGMWMVATVYGSKEVVKRRSLWGCIQKVASRKVPLIVGGDFNCILSQDDKRGGRKFVFSQGPKEMVEFMNGNDLHELAEVRHLARVASGHYPIVLRIFDSSFKVKDFSSLRMYGYLLEVQCTLLLNFGGRDFMAKVKEFSVKKEKLKEEIFNLQEEEANVGWLSEDKLWELRSKVKELNLTIGCLNTWWKQRAKVRWYEEGDANTKFFHSFANARRSENWISQVKKTNGSLPNSQRKWRKFSSEEQVAFVKGRCIVEHLLLAQEVSNKMRVSKAVDGMVAIKLDMEQAYDSMCWKTLYKMMGILGFPDRFWKFVMECILEPRVSISINGGFSKWIVGKSGFCQGKELGIRMAPNVQKVSHLLYADDVFLFSYAKLKSIKKVKNIICDYCAWTGQRLNPQKLAMIIGKTVDRRRRKKIARIMGIKQVEEMEYLGTKFSLRRLMKADFQILLDKSMKILNAWGNRYISLVGRLV